MRHELTPHEARVIGVLLEKEITTPDQYPLSLNALTNACNQKSNRNPVLQLDESVVKQALDQLIQKGLVWEKTTYGGRVEKYKHRFCNTEFSPLQLPAPQLAIVCELLLRGPQTPGELRSRASRMASFARVEEVEAALKALLARDRPLVAMLPREPGKRESRYRHLFCGDVPEPSPAAASTDSEADKARIA
ncbi:MAG: YceH family protein, partial [Pseudomonadota bacterium]|nr:YceH family protein [Pseudomonadota bacterium]